MKKRFDIYKPLASWVNWIKVRRGDNGQETDFPQWIKTPPRIIKLKINEKNESSYKKESYIKKQVG